MRDPEDLREEPGEESAAHMNGTTATNGVTNRTNGQHVVENNAISGQVAAPRAPSGRLTDEELRQQLAAQLDGDEDDDGVHL